jgi:hypothetical protein
VRDDFSPRTVDTLAKRVGVRCSSPHCRKLTTGPRSGASRIVCIGVGAHITAAAKGGKRYEASLTPEQRSSEDNGIWLCQNCAKLIDNDDARYTVALLRAWKERAEAAARAEVEGSGAHRPEDAAELELSIGGVAVGSGKPIRAKRHIDDARGTCVRHEYELAVIVRNLGNERLSGYHVDAELPARVFEAPETLTGYVAERSVRQRAFFRASGAAAPELFPGDASAVLTIPYYVDDDMFWNPRGTGNDHAYGQLVRVTLYRVGLPPIAVEKYFKELSNF